MLSIDSQIRCSAVGAPIVRSVMDISLSIEPTSPTIFRCACFTACSSVILPDVRSSLMSPGHSARKTSAPVSEPSPPQTTSASMPSLIRLCAAVRRPSCVRNATERAVPMSVPPYAGSFSLVSMYDVEWQHAKKDHGASGNLRKWSHSSTVRMSFAYWQMRVMHCRLCGVGQRTLRPALSSPSQRAR